MLIRIQNLRRTRVDDLVTFSGALGSQRDDAVVEDTSSNDRRFNRKDRWVITSEESDEKGRVRSPATIQVVAGPGGRSKVTSGFVSRGAYPEFQASLPVRIPARSSRYVMTFLSLEQDTARAVRAIDPFDRRRPSARLLEGIGRKVQKRVMNWDL